MKNLNIYFNVTVIIQDKFTLNMYNSTLEQIIDKMHTFSPKAIHRTSRFYFYILTTNIMRACKGYIYVYYILVKQWIKHIYSFYLLLESKLHNLTDIVL